ncbi:endoglucanase I [Xylariaceae sp. FL0255]|nr:endoglucanase I [Xylariaceae sp. FL0255]
MSRRFSNLLAAASVLAACSLVNAQASDGTADEHPALTTYKCTTSGGCTAQDTSVVIDWNYHWIHTADYLSCTTSSGVNTTLCPDEATCASNCMIQGDTNYTANGVTTSGDTLTMYQYVESDGEYSSASPRLYLLNAAGNAYEPLQLLGQELTFTVDLSTLPCGENGALYLSEMSLSGGSNQYTPESAAFGGGYCDAQCPVNTWRNGTINTSGAGYCCNEMDVLEANSEALAFTPHPCNAGNTACDASGCGYNPYGQGFENYYGPGKTVDTTKPFTVITQFITNDGTTSGTLTEINRKYIQNGVVIAPAQSTGDSLTTASCDAMDSSASTYGGLTTMGEALGAGMTLVFSIWNDNSQFMNWLDSGSAGPCSSTAGNPATILQNDPTTHVIFSNIRWGDIGSTFNSTTTTTTTTKSASSTTTMVSTSTPKTTVSATTTAAKSTQTEYGQCGGIGYTGPTTCATPYTCKVSNEYYSQCL